MCEIIVNQDQDLAIRYDPSMTLSTKPFSIDGKEYGINLMCEVPMLIPLFLKKKVLLGSFDTLEEAIKVMSDILNFKGRVYIVPGFSNYDGAEDFRKLLKNWTAKDESNLRKWAQV